MKTELTPDELAILAKGPVIPHSCYGVTGWARRFKVKEYVIRKALKQLKQQATPR